VTATIDTAVTPILDGRRLSVGADSRREPFGGLRAALVVAHPGHELRVHGWCEAARPRVLVLTDGSGASGRSRLASTARVLEAVGATPGPLFGRFTDRAFYERVLHGDTAVFVDLADELVEVLAGVDYVVGDAAEGYNPAHDVCRLLIDAAVARDAAARGRAMPSFEFGLTGCPDRGVADVPRRVRLALSDATFDRKVRAAHGYAELAREVGAALGADDGVAFREEIFDPAGTHGAPVEPPYYERYGEQRVAGGLYRDVLRHRAHVLPIARALANEER
jgi:hypothetical protein